ncbi:MAG: hypothetical protein ACI9DF_005176 [Verrucomicrobiales bacterium]
MLFGAFTSDGSSHATGDGAKGSMFIAWDENFPASPWPNGYTFSLTDSLLGDFTRIDGGALNGSFGEELLAGKDYSGDGFPDLFVGDLVGDSPNGSNSGLGYVLYNACKLRASCVVVAFPWIRRRLISHSHESTGRSHPL